VNRLNRKVEYALMALKLMAKKRPGELSSAKEISDAMGIPFDATARVLQMMAHRELLNVEQGAQGGYSIRRDLAKTSFHDLVESIEGPLEIARCLHGEESCELLSKCNIQSPVQILNRKLAQFYQALPLSEILRTKATEPVSGRISS
jgi:Rrf2 family transcriptional regulator, nitric oxide-sensitive transcriptional repressor